MITGPGQPVGAVEHGGVDRAARRLDRRLPRLPARRTASRRIEPTETAEAGWVQHVNDCADITLYPHGQLVVHGRQRARQAAGVPALHRRRRRLPRGVRRGRRPTATSASRSTGPARHAVQRRRGPPAAARRADGARHDGRAAACPPIESMSADEARAFSTRWPARAPARARGRRDRRRHAARRRRRPRLPPVPAGDARARTRSSSTSTAAAGCSAASESDDPFCRDLCVRSRRGHRLGQLPPRPGGPLPRRRRRRASPRCNGSPTTPPSSAASPASWRWPAGAPAATSPPSSASWRATPAARRSPASCCSRRSPTATSTPAVVPSRTPTATCSPAALMEWFWDHYADAADRTDPEASPLRAADLSDLPPALDRHVRVRPAARRGQRLRRRPGGRRRAGARTCRPGATPTRRSRWSTSSCPAPPSGPQMADALKSFVTAPVPG